MISLVFLGLKGKSNALSAFYGGSVVFLPSIAYALRSAVVRGNKPQDWLAAQYAGERIKFFVTMSLFALVFKYDSHLELLGFFTTFLVVLAVYWLALLQA
ncbi:MAG: ATP synthase subunit I [Betaproteobacteria bacterium]|nr:ATP synthase subunit I [Betaproteobacteria bacterium]